MEICSLGRVAGVFLRPLGIFASIQLTWYCQRPHSDLGCANIIFSRISSTLLKVPRRFPQLSAPLWKEQAEPSEPSLSPGSSTMPSTASSTFNWEGTSAPTFKPVLSNWITQGYGSHDGSGCWSRRRSCKSPVSGFGDTTTRRHLAQMRAYEQLL